MEVCSPHGGVGGSCIRPVLVSPTLPFGAQGTSLPGPPPLEFLWAPHKLVVRIVVEKGKLDELPAALFVEDGKHKVVEHAVLDVRESALDEGLGQEEADQGGLVLREPQGSQALEDAGDAQVVVGAAVGKKP